jgi:hypothetical protein
MRLWCIVTAFGMCLHFLVEFRCRGIYDIPAIFCFACSRLDFADEYEDL